MWQKAIRCIKNKTDVKVVYVYMLILRCIYIYTQLMLVYVVIYFEGRVSTFPERNAILLAWHVCYSSHRRRLRHCMFSQDFAIITHFYCIFQSCSSFLFAFPSVLFAHWVPWSICFTQMVNCLIHCLPLLQRLRCSSPLRRLLWCPQRLSTWSLCAFGWMEANRWLRMHVKKGKLKMFQFWCFFWNSGTQDAAQ